MSHVSIRARLIFLSVLWLVILAASSALLIRELMRHSQSLAEQARLVSIVRTATTASKHFGDLKYWLTDLASPSSRAPSKMPPTPRRVWMRI